MIVRAVVVPQPPLLVPELVGGALAGTEPVRTACPAAAAALAQVSAEWIAVAAAAALPAATARLDYWATPFGVGYHVAVWDPQVR